MFRGAATCGWSSPRCRGRTNNRLQKRLISTADLEDNLLRCLICFQKVAHIEEGVVLVAGVFTFQVVPAKFDELFSVNGHDAG